MVTRDKTDNWDRDFNKFMEESARLIEEFGLINKTMEDYRVELALRESRLILSKNQEEPC